jgi:hypothetical protein
LPVRAVTFQSIARTSSPGTYSRSLLEVGAAALEAREVGADHRVVDLAQGDQLDALRAAEGLLRMGSGRAWPRSPGGLTDADGVEHAAHDGVGVDPFGVGFVGEDETVAEDVGGDVLHVLRDHVVAALQEGPGLGGEGEVDGRARRGAELEELREVGAAGAVRGVASTSETT